MTVQAVGEASAEAKVSAEFEIAIASITGETNWVHEIHWGKDMTIGDAKRLGQRVGFVVGGVCIPFCCLATGGLVAWLLLRKRPAKKG
jgi:hypothetical protein